MPKIVELRQDRAHIRSNFDGYKLSLDTIPIIRQDLYGNNPPRNQIPNDNQFSLLHVELFSTQNLLLSDPWSRGTVYYVNFNGEVIRCNYDENIGRPDSLQVVYSLATRSYVRGDYNVSMRFVSEKYCIVCDGMQKLYLLDTGDRRKANEWKLIAQAAVSNDEFEKNFLIYDARLDILNEQKQISLALGRVHQEETNLNGPNRGSSHFMLLHWSHWIQRDVNNWEYKVLETLESKGSIYYCAFEPRADSLIISSNRTFTFKSQEKPEEMDSEVLAVEKPQLHGDIVEEYDFQWTQGIEDVIVKFPVKTGKEKADFKIKSASEALSVKCGDDILLEQNLFEKIDPDLTTWAIENNCLEVTLCKETPVPWPSLLLDGAGPKEKDSGTNIPMDQQPIANLEAPIEDCDFPMGSLECEVKIERYNLSTKSVTHNVILGSTPPLFSSNLRPGFPRAIATRQDVDACLWLQQYNPSKPNEWSLRHEGNLHAFGYIQASKQQRKFMDCAPDLSYAVITESFKHVFLYKMNYDTANGLRNRNGPQVTLGKQHLITLEDAGEVLGLATTTSAIILLTEKKLLYLQIN